MKKIVPWTVEGTAWDTFYSSHTGRLCLERDLAPWVGGPLPIPGTGPLILFWRAMAHGGNWVIMGYISFPSSVFLGGEKL